ncbi:ATP-binding protein [Candidatus Saccharibacteria bacterium]|nr:ATP-binding protein [Candidatus Saccharibacteria bacterium]
MSILIVLASFLVLVLAGFGFGYFYIRRLYREQKDYERGLKMVPVLIHLPPLSDDTEIQGRDTRDIVDENISRAQVLYSIVASIFQKGFRSRFYGQRHIGLEMVASKSTIHFYAAVPVNLLSVVEQAVVSAYPTARLEEVAEHNIFSPVGRITGTLGGELRLKESYVYPIATYQDIKRDSMQAFLNALSSVTKEDGAGIQILLRPAASSWRKQAAKEAAAKRKGKTKPKGMETTFWYIGQLFTALTKPPESRGGDNKDKPAEEGSSLDQSHAQAIEDKTKQPGFEVLIRVVASSNITQRAQTVLNNLVATFSLFDIPGSNGFKFVPARNIDSFVTEYILRLFPQAKDDNILNATELATLFHFPDQQSIPTSQLQRQASKQVDGPHNVPEEGLLLGYNMFRGAKKAIRLSQADRTRHMYAVGQTGTGKSTFLENLALQDMLEGRGFAFVDPHGDTAEKLLAMVPKERTEDVIYFSPADTDYPMGLNMFEYHSPDQKDFLIQEAINMLYKLYDPGHTGIIGPRYEHIFRNAALTVMADPAGGTFVDIPKLFRDPQFVDKKLQHVTDQNVIEFWRKEMPQSQRSTEFGEVISWFVSKFGAFLSNEMMRNIIGQTKSSFNLRQIMDEGKILLVNLSRGRAGDLNSKLLGMIFVMKFEAAAMSRADIPEEYRRDFCLYVDEFQNFSTDSFADILSQARKYHLNLIVANQFTTQLSEEIRDAVFGNVGTVISYRVGTTDAEFLAKQFAPVFDIDDLQFIPNFNMVVRMMIGGVPVQPFSMAGLPPLGNPNKQLADALKQLSAAKFGRPRAEVEAEIFERLKTTPKPPPSFASRPASPWDNLPTGQAGYGGLTAGAQAIPARPPAIRAPTSLGAVPSSSLASSPAQPSAANAQPSSGGSFLDEWLAKRSGTAPPRPAGSAFSPGGTGQYPPPAGTGQYPTPPPASPLPMGTAQMPPAPSPVSPSFSSPPSSPAPLPTQDLPKPQPADHSEFKIPRDPAESPAAAPPQDADQSLKIDEKGNLTYQ